MNPYSLRSKKKSRQQSFTTIIDLSSLDSDDVDNECSSASSTRKHGTPAEVESLLTPKRVSLPEEEKKTAATTEEPAKYENHHDVEHAQYQCPVARDDPPQEKNSTCIDKDTTAMLRPEVTTSNSACTSKIITNDFICPQQCFDTEDYSSLCQRYLTTRIRDKPELPDGMILRRQYRGRIIDANTPFHRKLRVKVDALLKKNHHEQVYRLLCQLRIWELDPRRVPAIFQNNGDDADVVQVFDLTNSKEQQSCIECIDVDDDFNAETVIKLSSSGPEIDPSSEQDAVVVGRGLFDDEQASGTNKQIPRLEIERSPSLSNDCCAAPKLTRPLPHASLDTHSTKAKLSKATFYEWLTKKKISWRRRRNKCGWEQKFTPLIWSPSSLRKASLLVKPAGAEKLQAIQSHKQAERGYPGALIPSDVVLTAPLMNESSVVSPPKPSSRSCEIRGGSSIVVTPDGKPSSPDIFSKKNAQSKKERPIKRRLHEDEKFTHDPRWPSPFCAFKIYDFGFPYLNKLNRREISIDLINETSSRASPAHTRRKKRRKTLQNERSTVHNFKFPIIPHSRMNALSHINVHKTTASLREDWNRQITKRKKGEWIPRGHVTGRWKPPVWADVKRKQESICGADSMSHFTQKKSPGCRKSLLPVLDGIMENYAVDSFVRRSGTSFSSYRAKSLQDVISPQYVKPTMDLLRNAHAAVRSLLPQGDCEEWEVVELARSYYNYWRPKETKVILLAESHAYTSKDRALDGPGLDKDILNAYYFGPRKFISLVYCLSYGENESLTTKINDQTNKGTPQFWTLLAACARGVDHIACTPKPSSSPFATDLLKVGQLPVEERLQAKLEVLENLRRRGIWLIDTSVFGWYISQPQAYTRSRISNEVHRKQKSRPPSELKVPSLVLSWELFTKHVVREVAEEGHLKYLIPIGMEVEAAVTRKRMEDAIRSRVSEQAQVSDTFPAPNAWIPGGYGPFHAKLAKLVNEAAPRSA